MCNNHKKIIVFGGSGFLGSHVADKLTDYGHDVTIFDLVPSPFLRSNQKMILGNILDEDIVKDAISGNEIVYNFAGYADLDTAGNNPKKTAELNILGNINVIESCLKKKVEQYIYASTMYVYSEAGGFYRCSKQASEVFIEEYNRRFGVNFTILRYGTLYGPRADERNSIYKYLISAMNYSEIKVKGTGDEVREYIHVRDAAKVSAKIISKEYYNKRFVITGHQAIPLRQMLEMIGEILHKPINIIFESKSSYDHYKITPYSFVPKIGEKFSPDIYTDMGQGLIECLADMMEKK